MLTSACDSRTASEPMRSIEAPMSKGDALMRVLVTTTGASVATGAEAGGALVVARCGALICPASCAAHHGSASASDEDKAKVRRVGCMPAIAAGFGGGFGYCMASRIWHESAPMASPGNYLVKTQSARCRGRLAALSSGLLWPRCASARTKDRGRPRQPAPAA